MSVVAVGVVAISLVGGGVAAARALTTSDAEAIVTAGERNVEAGTARIAMTTIIDGGIGESKQRLDANGLYDFEARGSWLEMRVGPPKAAGEPVESVGGMSLVLASDGKSTAVRNALWEADRWEPLSEDGSATDAFGSADLGSQLRSLAEGFVEVSEVGEEQVRGERTTHYSLVVDLEEAARATEGAERAALEDLHERQAGRPLGMDVWVGEEYVHRVRYTINHAADVAAEPVPASPPADEPTATAESSPAPEDPATAPEETPPTPAGGQGATVTSVVEYYDFAVPFTADVPTS